MTVFQAVVLGIIQGLTEFIPVSSSAHLIVAPWLFNWSEPSLAFDISLHLGTLAALIWFFAKDWRQLIRAGIASIIERKIGADTERRLAWLLLISCIPGAAVGVLAESKIEQLFHQANTPISLQAMFAMAILIILLGVALLIAERFAKHQKELRQLSLNNALIIGFVQALSIFPGVSRSGSTITGGLAIGLKREEAARFSFLLATPMIAGAGIMGSYDIKWRLDGGAITLSELGPFIIGFLAAAISGYLCIKFLLRFLQKNPTNIFVYYRWLLAALILVVVFVRS